ncbi:MAG: alpha/beta fold hydrolase [Xanthobacteraceae bacterium]
MSEANAMTRREAISAGTLGLGAAALGSANATAQSGPRKTFVLVHGAWHGGWCWRRVADRLGSNGHKVFAPTLTGLADRSHLLSSNINLDTHITDIVNLFKWEDITGACLVAHSYGGWPCSGALEQIGDRVSSIVWVDAFLPKNGERGIDGISEFSRKALDEAVAKGELGRQAPSAKAFRIISEADQKWVDSKVTPQPNAIPMQAIKLTGARDKVAKKTYIRARQYPQPTFDKALAECEAQSWATYSTNDAGHDIMVDAPDWLSDILMKQS